MDQQRPLLYLTLVFLGFMLWSTWKTDKAPKLIQTPTTQQQNSQATPVANNASVLANSDIPQQASSNTDIPVIKNSNNQGSTNSAQTIVVKTDVLQLHISTQGGTITKAALPSYPISLKEPDKPIVILDPTKNYFAQSGLRHKNITGGKSDLLAPNHYALYQSAQSEYTMKEGEDTLVVPLTWRAPNGLQVTKTFTFKRKEFLVEVAHTVNNQSTQNWSGFEYRQLTHAPVSNNAGLFSGVNAYVGGAYYNFEEGKYKYETIRFDDFNDPSEKVSKKIIGGWAAMLEHYFISAWIPNQQQSNTYYTLYQEKGTSANSILGLNTAFIDIAPQASYTFKSQFYVGPKIQEKLESIAKGLDLTVDYGIFTIISQPIFYALQYIHSIVGNWGWSIILITIFIKLLFFYPSALSYRSMAKMKKLSPKIKALQERTYSDPQAKQKAMMAFYKKEKINPVGGCLPMLIQIPVFMGLYWVLLESVELRQAPWILWFKDLSVMDPYFVLPLIMGGSMFLQQKLNPPQMDPMQQKIFMWLPVFFTFIFLFFPAGLVLYWVVNNVLSIAQQWFINKKIINEA